MGNNMNHEQLSNLINIRDFAQRNFDNINFKLSNEEVRALRVKIVSMDKVILSEILALSPNEIKTEKLASTDAALGFIKHGVPEVAGVAKYNPKKIKRSEIEESK